MAEKPLTENFRADGEAPSLQEYLDAGGYEGVRKALQMEPKAVQDEVAAANVMGRGGAGFSTAHKWSFVPLGPDARRPKYFVVNADEMEPGTMKDRFLMEGDPHGLVEGLIIASYAIEASESYIFLRWAYNKCAERLTKAIQEAYDAGFIGKNILGSGYDLEMHLHTSAGRYMCGEEDGLLDALEGRRATPRTKPPYPQTVGLWGMPTVVQNAETVCNLRHLIRHGAEWYRGLSLTEHGGTKIYGASGRVKNPGLWEMPVGTTIGELFHGLAGGMQDGYAFRGLLPGGASTSFLVEEHMDAQMDFKTLQQYGSRMGTGTMIILDDHTCPVGMVLNLERFYARESCGWCTPCREGLPWLVQTLEAIEEGRGVPEDLDILDHHVELIRPHHTFCSLAPGAIMPLEGALKYFREDFERHIREGRCPWR